MSIKLKHFSPGDYVEVDTGIHDTHMPDNGRRDGLVVQIVGSMKDQAIIMFHTGKFLKFHRSSLKIIEKLRRRDYNKNIDQEE
jgi:hypothetical protein